MGSRVPLSTILRLLQTPDMLAGGIRYRVRKELTANLDYNLRDGYSAPPIQLDIKIVNACNLRCKMCAQWGESGYNLTKPSAEIKEVVPLDIYKRVVDELSSIKPWIYIWGGEPFLYRDLLPLMSFMKQNGLIGSIVTNGTKLAKHSEEMVDIGWDVVMVSIDGPRDTHDNIRGFKGAFDNILSGVKAIQEEKRRRGRVKPYIVLLATVTGDNAHNLDEIFQIGEDIQVDLIHVYYAWYQTQESGRRHTEIMQEKLDTTPWSWTGWIWSYDEINTAVLVETVKRIKSRKYSFHYRFVPDLKYEDIPRYYQEHSNTFGYKKCVAPWVMAEIMPNGDVVTCRDYPDYVVGNIKNDSLLKIWNNERSRKFRTVLKEEGSLFPICTRCCGLMGW